MKRLLVLGAFAVAAIAVGLLSDLGRALVFGWIDFLATVLPHVSVRTDAVLSGVVVAALFTLFADWTARSYCRAMPQVEGRPPRQWRFRWTLSIVTTVVLMFIVGFSAIAAARHIGWIVSDLLLQQ